MTSNEDRAFFMRAVETSIRIGLIALLVIWCFQIVRPFIQLILWGIILAIAVHPAYLRLCRVMGGRERLSAIVLVVGSILLLTVPSVLITTSLVESTTELAVDLHEGEIKIPPPPASVADWPIVGERLHAFWSKASQNLEAALGQAGPLVKATGQWILSSSAAAGFDGLLHFLELFGRSSDQQHLGPSSAQSVGERLSDPARSAGDHDRPASNPFAQRVIFRAGHR